MVTFFKQPGRDIRGFDGPVAHQRGVDLAFGFAPGKQGQHMHLIRIGHADEIIFQHLYLFIGLVGFIQRKKELGECFHIVPPAPSKSRPAGETLTSLVSIPNSSPSGGGWVGASSSSPPYSVCTSC